MVAGQVIDLLGEGQSMTVEELEELHGKKTGALFLASVRGGARLGGASASQIESLDAYARALGLAFQVVDDLLDVEALPSRWASARKKDGERGKATYPAILGSSARWIWRASSRRGRIARCDGFDDRADPLRHLATFRRGAQAVSAAARSPAARIARRRICAPGGAGRAGPI